MRRIRLFAAVLAAALLLFAGRSAAQSSTDTHQQFWPEVDFYQRLTDYTRLYALTSAATGANDSADNVQFGLNFDLFPKPRGFFTPLLGAASLVADRQRPFQFRLGYRYSETLNSDGTEVQNRILAEFTVKRDLWGIITADRNGFDWRWTDGVYSTRYRNRLYLEFPSEVRSYQFTPYTDVEVFYTLASGSWSQVQYEAGFQFPILPRATTEIYAALQNSWGNTPSSVVAIGLNLVLAY